MPSLDEYLIQVHRSEIYEGSRACRGCAAWRTKTNNKNPAEAINTPASRHFLHMDPDLLPSLVSYYQSTQCTKEIGYKIDIRKYARANVRLESKLEEGNVVQADLRAQIEELRLTLAKTQSTSDVRQREVESLRARYQDNEKADKAQTDSLKIQADSYKREIREIRDDLKLREEEIRDIREDVKERDNDVKEARELTRNRDKEIKEVRDQLRLKDSEIRKSNHKLEKLASTVQRLELDIQEASDALEATKEMLAEADERRNADRSQQRQRAANEQKTKQNLKLVKTARVRSPSLASLPDLPNQIASPGTSPVQTAAKNSSATTELLTDYNEPPSKPARKTISRSPVKKTALKSSANKENVAATKPTASKKRKAPVVTEFSASPPRSSPPPESPKRKKVLKSDFSMTPFIDKTKKSGSLSLVPLSPPSSKLDVPHGKSTEDTTALVPLNDSSSDINKPKKKRKLLGGLKTLMDDTPKKGVVSRAVKSNFGKDLSPLKRPKSSAGLILSAK